MIGRGRVFYGWWVVAALFFVGMLGPMGRYTVTAFSPFMQQELGWGATDLGLTLSISLWVYALAALPVGWMIDRIGSRKVIFLGGVLLLVGLILVSRVRSLWQLYLIFGLLVGSGVSMTHFLATQSTSRKWFTKRAGLAGGVLTTAFWMGAALLTPMFTGLASSFGWRTTCFVYGLGAGIVIISLAKWVIRDTPESMGLHPDGEKPWGEGQFTDLPTGKTDWAVKEALKTRTFWMILLGYCLMGIPGQGFLGHLVLWGVELGAPKATAGLSLTAFAFSTALTPIFGGWLADRFGKRRVMVIGFGIGALVLIGGWLTVQSLPGLLVFGAIFGLVYGVPSSPGLWTAYMGDLFGRSQIGQLYGTATLGYGLIGGSGPLIWGWVHDTTGSYNAACLVSGIGFLLIAICLLLTKPVSRDI